LTYQAYPDSLGSSTEFLSHAIQHGVGYIVHSEIEHLYYPNVYYLRHLDDFTGITRIYRDPKIAVYEIAAGLSPGDQLENTALAARREELAEVQQTGDPLGIIDACQRLANMQISHHQWQSAATYLERGLAIASELPATKVGARICTLRLNLSLAYLHLGRCAAGLAVLRDNLDTLTASCQPDRLAVAHALMARNYQQIGQRELALAHLAQARDIHLRLNDQRQAAAMQEAINRLRSGE
jgi:hypothetical protein